MCYRIRVFSLLAALCFSFVGIIASLQDQCTGYSLNINADADVKISAILSLRENADGQCGTTVADGVVQYVGLIQWVVDRLNAANFVDGVKIGVDVHDDCGIARNSIARALDVVDGRPLGSEACARTNDTACYIGILGTSSSSTTGALLEVIRDTAVPLISPYATDPSLTNYDNFYRTVHAEDRQVDAIVGLLEELGWTYVAAVYVDDGYGTYGVQELTRRARLRGICVDVLHEIKMGEPFDISMTNNLLRHIDMTKDATLGVVFFGNKIVAKTMLTQLKFAVRNNNKITKLTWIMPDLIGTDIDVFDGLDSFGNRTLTLSQYSEVVTSAQDFITQKWESVISGQTPQDDLEHFMACTGSTSAPYWVSEYVLSTIDAVYAFALTLQRKQRFHCDGAPGMCDDLRRNFKHDITSYPVLYASMADNVSVLEFKATARTVLFSSDGDLVPDPALPVYVYSMYGYNPDQPGFTQIGIFGNNEANITDSTTLDSLPRSDCGASCPACTDDTGLRYAYLDGDTLLLGLFSLHQINTDDPFDCGKFRFASMDVIIIEAFIHTVEQLKETTGINFGAIVLDDCYSSTPTEFLLASILSGERVLYKPNSDNETIDVSKIAAVVVSLGSDETIPVALLLTKLRLPLISSAASSPDLDDKINFPYFLRTVPSDEEQARAMVSIITKMEWEYVSVVYVKNNYGTRLKEKFVQLAEASDICIANEPEGISDNDNDKIELQALFSRLSNHQSKVVVYLGTERQIANLLEVIDNRNDFIFLASEDWGDRQYILDVGGDSTKGSITLKNEITKIEGNTFANHISLANPYNNTRNPWFGDYWEEMFHCDLPQNFDNKYKKICEKSQLFTDDSIQEFLKDQRVVHTMKAVHALGKGLVAAKEDTCKFETTFPCRKYFQYIYPDVIRDIREVTLREGNIDTRVFKNDGNGNVGFQILNIQTDGSQTLHYKQVGSYDEMLLNLETDNIALYRPDFSAGCTGALCGSCRVATVPSTVATTTHSHTDQDQLGLDDYIVIGILAFLVVFILILFIIVICYLKKRVAALQRQLKETTTEIYRERVALTSGYATQNGSAGRSPSAVSLNYPTMQYVDPSGLDPWRRDQHSQQHPHNDGHVSPTGIVNLAFVSNEMYSPIKNDENQNIPSLKNDFEITPVNKNTTTQNTDGSPKSQHMYGLSTHHSFKKQENSNQLNSPVKKQPRTQLNVPPCRPELPPPRADATPRPQTFPDDLILTSPSVPKDRVRKVRSTPRRSKPPSLLYTSTQENSPRYSAESASPRYNPESPRYGGTPPYMAFSSGSVQSSDQQTSPTSRINVAGSMEKVSRV